MLREMGLTKYVKKYIIVFRTDSRILCKKVLKNYWKGIYDE